MKVIKKSGILFLCFTCLLISSCLFANVQSPLTTQFDKTQIGMKSGESKCYSVLWLVAWGDAGSKAAADNGGIKVIRHADQKVFTIFFGLFTEVTTIVYGE